MWLSKINMLTLYYLLITFLLISALMNSYIQINMSETLLYNLEFMVMNNSFYFCFLVLMVSMIIMFYSSYYMMSEFNLGFYTLMMSMFISSMLSLLLAFNWTVLILSWEGLGISSFFLINYYQSWESHNNSMMTMLTMRLGDYFFFMFVSSFVLYNYLGMYVYKLNVTSGSCLLLVSLTKSSQIPFSSWLPKAMSAPTPTSALVHSSTLVTAGVILVSTYSEALMNNMLMTMLLFGGFLTMVMGSLSTLMEYSVKKMVAFSTMSQMGLSMMVCGLGHFNMGLLNLIAHGFAKSLLFIQVGHLIHMNMNQQNWRKWKGFMAVEGLLKMQLLMSLLSLCGIMFMSGMLSKESIIMLMEKNSWYFLMYMMVLLCLYLTYLYSIIIYKSLLSTSNQPITYFKGSVIMMMVTLLELLLLLMYFKWMLMNVIYLPHSFSYSETLMPLSMLCMTLLILKSLTVMAIKSNFMVLLMNLGGSAHYTWLKYIPVLYLIENHAFMLHNMLLLMFRSMSMNSLTLNSGNMYSVLSFMVVMLLLLW